MPLIGTRPFARSAIHQFNTALISPSHKLDEELIHRFDGIWYSVPGNPAAGARSLCFLLGDTKHQKVGTRTTETASQQNRTWSRNGIEAGHGILTNIISIPNDFDTKQYVLYTLEQTYVRDPG